MKEKKKNKERSKTHKAKQYSFTTVVLDSFSTHWFLVPDPVFLHLSQMTCTSFHLPGFNEKGSTGSPPKIPTSAVKMFCELCCPVFEINTYEKSH